MIWTSYFDNIPKIPEGYCLISIDPFKKDWDGLVYHKLYPQKGFTEVWKKEGSEDNSYYLNEYTRRILGSLRIGDFLKDLTRISGGSQDIVLLSEESPGTFGHRQIVLDWIRHHGIQVEEFPS